MSNNSISVTCASVRDCSYYFLDQATKCTIIGDVTVLETCVIIRENTVSRRVIIAIGFGYNGVDSLVDCLLFLALS